MVDASVSNLDRFCSPILLRDYVTVNAVVAVTKKS